MRPESSSATKNPSGSKYGLLKTVLSRAVCDRSSTAPRCVRASVHKATKSGGRGGREWGGGGGGAGRAAPPEREDSAGPRSPNENWLSITPPARGVPDGA